MNKPLISVLMPVYNGELFVEDAVKSVLNQSYSNFELIIVNDNSNDQTENIIQKFKDKRIVYIKNLNRLGLALNRNKALSLAKGKYIAILDADDLSSRDRFIKQISFLEKNNEYVLCGSWAQLIDENNTILALWRFPYNFSAIRARFFIQFPIVHSSAMIRAASIKKMKLEYDHRFEPAEDYDFCFKLLNAGKVGIIKDNLVQYRVHSSNVSKNIANTVLTKIPMIYEREYLQNAIPIKMSRIVNLVKLYNPQAKLQANIFLGLKDAYILFINLHRKYALTITDSIEWWIYTLKAVILQLRLGFFYKPKARSAV